MVVGDTHCNYKAFVPKIMRAGAMGIQTILQVGDFGLWDHTFDGAIFLDKVNRVAEDAKLTVYAIGGNHENWDHWEWYVNNMATSKGFAMVRSRIALAPKIHHWRWNNKQFVSAGGAVSVDRDFYRLPREAGTYVDEFGRRPKATGPRTLYWPNEELTDQDVHKLEMLGKKADYLITHDCSNYTPWKSRLKEDADSHQHRRRINEVLRATKPELHFHGHMHEQYDWVNSVVYGNEHHTQTYGLERDDMWNSWGILDTDTDTFKWRDNE